MTELTEVPPIAFFDPYAVTGPPEPSGPNAPGPTEILFELDAAPNSAPPAELRAEQDEEFFDVAEASLEASADDRLDLDVAQAADREAADLAEEEDRAWFDQTTDEEARAEESVSGLVGEVQPDEFFDTGEQSAEEEPAASGTETQAGAEGDQDPESLTQVPDNPTRADMNRAEQSYNSAIARNNVFNQWMFDTYHRS